MFPVLVFEQSRNRKACGKESDIVLVLQSAPQNRYVLEVNLSKPTFVRLNELFMC